MDHIQNDVSNNSCIVVCIFIAVVILLPSDGSNGKGIHIQTQRDGRDL
jgi:hypothetical protein